MKTLCLPDNYKYLPFKSAIDNKQKITMPLFMDLSSKLGSKFLSLVERDSYAAPKDNPKKAKLQDVKILGEL
jgi:hypothetical protein